MNPRSIAIFTWGLDQDAFPNLAAALCRGLQDLGIRKLYILYLAHGTRRSVTFPEGVELIHLGVQRSRWAPVPLARFLKEVKPDVLISMPAFINMSAILGWLLGGHGFTKLVVTEHATMSYKAFVEQRSDLRMLAQPLLARLLYPKADGIVANSQAVLEDLLTQICVPIQRNHAVVIPNPVDIEAVASRSQAKPDHPWLQHKEGPIILSVGRLSKQKNFTLLLKAFTAVRRRWDAKLIILGEGSEKRILESQIAKLGLEDNVSLPGFSENPWSNMARADVFVLPSEEEAFGLVLVEAMICGVPIVATDAIGGGPRSILEDGKYGNLVPSDDAEALAEAICQVLTSQDLHDQLVAGKQRCEAFKPKAVAQQWLSFIEQLDEEKQVVS